MRTDAPDVSGSLFRSAGSSDGTAEGRAEFRTELKFDFENADEGKVRSALEVSCRRVIHGGPVSRVMSLYFDDARLGDCARSMDGTGERAKVRLRWYDTPWPSPLCWFEIKRRHHGVMSKRRFALECRAPLPERSHQEISDSLAAALPDDAAVWLVARPFSVVIVQYDREHYTDAASGVRLTLDRKMVSYLQAGAIRPSLRFGLSVPDRFILEAKGDARGLRSVPALLHPLRPRVSRYSKYVSSCQAGGLFMGAEAAIAG